ncbi:MAG: septation protein A [Alphaproteobacteria bacterium]
MKGYVRFGLDMGPLLVFFIVYRATDNVLPATAALIPATLLALGIIYWLEKRVAVMPLVSGIAVAVFGGLTLILADELFIKMKPTFVNLLFAAILLVGVVLGRPMLKYALSEAMQLTEEGWMILSRRWGFYFVFLAGLNEVIWRNFPTDFWVDFKVFGMFTLSILFTLSQIPFINRHMVQDDGNQEH